MNKVERYEALIKAALEVQQLKIELRRKLEEVGENITVRELRTQCFSEDDAKKALTILSADMLKIEEASHVGAKAIYKDVEVCLHCSPSSVGREAMKHILEGIEDSEIFNAKTVKL